MVFRSVQLLTLVFLMSAAAGCSLFDRGSEPQASSSPTPSTAPSTTPSTVPSTALSTTPSASPSPKVSPTPGTKPTTSPSPSPSSSTTKPSEVATPPKKSPPASPPSKDEKLISELKKEVETKTAILTDNSGKISLNRLLLAQKAQWLIAGAFTSDLKALDAGVPIETDNYKFQVEGNSAQQIKMSAIAKKDKLPSYSGTVLAVSESLPASGICQTKVASKSSPPVPTYKGNKFACDSNSVLFLD